MLEFAYGFAQFMHEELFTVGGFVSHEGLALAEVASAVFHEESDVFGVKSFDPLFRGHRVGALI